MDKVTNDARVYTDIQGLESLRGQYKTNPGKVKKEVAQQFEAFLMQMLLRSMRDANKSFESGLLSSNDMAMYQDMFDKQITLSLSERGIGFAKTIEDQIDRDIKAPLPLVPDVVKSTNETKAEETHEIKINPFINIQKADKEPIPEAFKTPKEFVTKLWSSAKEAAQLIGVHPGVLLAQAALETDWGKKIISHSDVKTSHNLFNIKSDSEWKKDSIRTNTLEQRNGVLVKEAAQFRSYGSFEESFKDYAKMIKTSARYEGAIEKATDPKAYAQELQAAGYASDENYASKIMDVYNSPRFQALIKEQN